PRASRAAVPSRSQPDGDTSTGARRTVPQPLPPVALTPPSAPVISEPLWEALRRAAERVYNDPLAIEQGTQSDDLRCQVDALCRAVRQAADGEEPMLERAAPAVPVQRV